MHLQELCTLQPLFLKPLYYPGTILYSSYSTSIGKTLSFKSFDLDRDTPLVHQWVNQPYALPFWRLAVSKEHLYNLYYSIQRNSNAHSYLVTLDDFPIAQFDVYRVLADEIKQFIAATEHDCGFHLLMAPNTKPIAGLTKAVLQTFLEYYFSFPTAGTMYAEPDIANKRSNQLLQRTSFHFHHAIKMSYKTANLYSITKEQFYASSNTIL